MTDHVKDQLCARIEELEAEKLELNEQLDVAQREREALAAHLESLIQEIEGALRIKDLWLPSHCEPEHEGECQALGMMHSAFLRVVVETPETSLARRDAQQQLEGARQMYDELMLRGKAFPGRVQIGTTALKLINRLRRQAEGGET